MTKQLIIGKKHPNGYCAQIAEIVDTDRNYVSKVLRNPEKYNGKLANEIKATDEKINSFRSRFKAALLTAKSQNTMKSSK